MSVTTEVKDIRARIAELRERKIELKEVPRRLTAQELEWIRISTVCPEISNVQQALQNLGKKFWDMMFTTIDFDNDLNGNPIPDKTQLDDIHTNPYQSLGVTFTALPGPIWDPKRMPMPHVWIRPYPDEAASTPNIVTLDQWEGGGDFDVFGQIMVSFESPHQSVFIDARVATLDFRNGTTLSPGSAPYLRAFDANGQLLGEVQFPPDQIPQTPYTLSQPHRLAFGTDSPIISSAYFSCSYPEGADMLIGYFDNLVISRVMG